MESYSLDVTGLKYSGSSTSEASATVVDNAFVAEPIKVHLSSDTDFYALAPSIAGVLVTLLVAGLTLRVQRKQTAANLSNLRQQWMKDLRDVGSEYMRCLYKLALDIRYKSGYKATGEYLDLYEKMVVAGSQFEMLLSRDDAETKKIDDLDQRIIDAIREMNEGDDFDDVMVMLDQMKGFIRIELESAWNDIKKDVGLGEGWLSRSRKLIGRVYLRFRSQA